MSDAVGQNGKNVRSDRTKTTYDTGESRAMKNAKSQIYVLITDKTDLPDYFMDETILRTMRFQSDPGVILVNTNTGSFKIRNSGKSTAVQYNPNYRKDTTLGLGYPSMAQIFEAISNCVEENWTIYAESIFEYGNTPGEISEAYVQFLKNPNIELKFHKTGWLDSSVIRNIINIIGDSAGINHLNELIRTTFETHEKSPATRNEEYQYQGIREKLNKIKKKTSKPI